MSKINLFQLTLEDKEEKTIFDQLIEENKEEQEYHNFIPDNTPDDEKEQLDRIYNTIDSLESVYVTLLSIEEQNLELTPNDIDNLSERISLAYDKNGLIEDMPLSISTEGYATTLDSNLAIESIKEDLAKRVKALTNSSNNVFTKLIEKTKGLFKSELDKLGSIRDRAAELLEQIKEGKEFNGGSLINIKNVTGVTVGGKANPLNILDKIESVSSDYLVGNKFLHDYLDDVKTLTDRMAQFNLDDKDVFVEKKQEACNDLFKPSKDFIAWKGNADYTGYNGYLCKISDRYGFSLSLPDGSSNLCPKDSRFINNTSYNLKNTHACSKKEAIEILSRIINVIDTLSTKQDITETGKEIKKELDNIAKHSNLGSKLKKELEQWLENEHNFRFIRYLRNAWNIIDIVEYTMVGLAFIPMTAGLSVPIAAAGAASSVLINCVVYYLLKKGTLAFIMNLPNLSTSYCISLFKASYKAFNHTFVDLIDYVDASRRV